MVGIEADAIRALAREFATAEAASIHVSTGVNMGRQGTLAYWLAQMLSLVTGNLGRRGGNLYSPGYFPAADGGTAACRGSLLRDRVRPPCARSPATCLPICSPSTSRSGKVKALIVMAGNPLLSVGGGPRLRRAFDKLELCVVIDIYPSATAELADYALPATDWLERADVNALSLGFQPKPFAQHTDAVVAPKFERRPEWWILASLAERLGLPLPVKPDGTGLNARHDRQLATAGLSRERLRQSPSGTEVLPLPTPEALFEIGVQNPGGRIDCCPPLFDSALHRAEELFNELLSEPASQLKLITLRTNTMLNSWFANLPSLKRDYALDNPLYMNPEDAERLGLKASVEVRVESASGAVIATLALDDSLRLGVVAMTHGWGHAASPALKVASNHPGVNVNDLLPAGAGSFEPLSNQAHMTGIPVEVRAA